MLKKTTTPTPNGGFDVLNVFTDKVNAMTPYPVAVSAGMIKLNDMESPYKLPEDMRAALGQVLAMRAINRYPNAQSTSTVAKLKSTFDLPKNCDVMLGNGSDELIQIILTATARPNATVLSPAPSFVMYRQTAELLGMNYVGVDLNADFSLDEAAFLQAIETHRPAVVFLAYPNNPTGFLLDKAFIRRVIASTPGLVVFDEAYTAYASDSAMELLSESDADGHDKYDNVVLIRTLSKIGLAGIRLGYLVAPPHLTKSFEKVRMPYNINVLTQATTRFMLDQMTFINDNIDKILCEKQVQYDWLATHPKITVYPSETNFLLLRVDDATDVFTRLRDDYKILVKNLHGSHPILDNMLRLTIGHKKENTKVREALTEILGK